MANAFARAAFTASQTARVGWYFGQYLYAARISPSYSVPPVQGGQVPGVADILRDILREMESGGGDTPGRGVRL